jgi:hypothetical protein
MKFLIWLDKLSVQITTGQTCPVVANNHTIWIRHWNHFENNFLSQLLGFSALACNELDEPLHNKARIAFSWMHSCCHNYVFLVLIRWHLILVVIGANNPLLRINFYWRSLRYIFYPLHLASNREYWHLITT